MPLSPFLAELQQYPFVRLDEWRAEARAGGLDVIDFGVGDPREPTPAFIRQALADGITEVSSYPRAVGLPELRAAVSAWIARRFGVEVDAGTEIVPTLGSKEAIFSFAQVALTPEKPPGRRCRSPGIRSTSAAPVRRRADPHGAAARAHGWLPDLDAFDRWDELAVFWTCYPNNPTGAHARRSRSTRSWPPARASTGFCSARTRPTRSSGSTSRPPRRSRSPTGRTSSSSTPSRSDRR